jgi:radical SAM superfamily enzyme YgiQ (UPF0313 family)
MKVMLINPLSDLAKNGNMYYRSVTPLPPLGIAYLSAALKDNSIEVIVEDQYASRLSNEDLVKKAKHFSPDIIGFSCLTTAMSNVNRLVNRFRQGCKDAVIVLGNIHPTIFPEDVLSKNVADIVIRGEGEKTLSEVATAVDKRLSLAGIKGISYRHNGSIQHNPEREIIEDLDVLPYPDWHSLDIRYYRRYPMLGIYNKLVLPVQASRGCIYNCLFCSQDKFYKKPRYRKIKKVVDEIEYLYEEFKIDYIGFTDAYFPFSKESGLEFCDELIRRKLHKKIKWFTETRVDMVDLELLRRMKESSASLVMYGFEVGDPGVLQDIGKGTTLAQAIEAMDYTRKCGIRSLGLFMLGLPSDTEETCRETIRFAKRLNPDICKFNIAVPFPGSKFFEKYMNKIGSLDSINDKFTSWYDWSECDDGIIYSPKGMTKKELVNLQREGMFNFYMRPNVILKHLVNRTFSLSDLFYGGCILLKNYFKMFSSTAGTRKD